MKMQQKNEACHPAPSPDLHKKWHPDIQPHEECTPFKVDNQSDRHSTGLITIHILTAYSQMHVHNDYQPFGDLLSSYHNKTSGPSMEPK